MSNERKKTPHTILPDGTLVFKVDGNPPKPIAGYTQRPGDPYTWIPDFAEDCKYRSMEKFLKPCKEWRCVFMCSLFEKCVNQVVCNSCDKAEQ